MSLIKRPSELKITSSIKLLIYGQPGIGKSTLALSAPSPIFFDFDGGIHRVKSTLLKDTVQIESWDNMIEVLDKENLSGYRTFIIDTAGKMLDYMADYLIRKNPKLAKGSGALTLQGYGERKAEFRAFLRRISMMGKDLVFVAHEVEDKDGEQKIVRPEIGGSSGSDLIKELDLVGYMQAIGKKKTITFDPTEKFYGKNTCGIQPLLELPDINVKPNNLLSTIFNDYQKNLELRQEMIADYNDLMELINGKVDSIEDAETANEVSKWAGEFESHIWDSKLQAGMKINTRAKEVGLSLNKETKKYEAKAVENV